MNILKNQTLTWKLSSGKTLRALSLTNHLTGTTTRFHAGHELKVRVDGGADRITIGGWRGIPIDPDTPDAQVCAQPAFNDEQWEGFPSGIVQLPGTHRPVYHAYRRTHVFIPRRWQGKQARFVFGGWRLFDFRSIRVFLNGHEIAHREVSGDWHEPGDIELPAHLIRYNQDNVIFLKLEDQITRTPELDAFDPLGNREFTWQAMWPAQFEQFLYCGNPKKEVTFAVTSTRTRRNSIRVDLQGKQAPLQARIDYTLKAGESTLHRRVTLKNSGKIPLRVLDVDLGHYATDREVSPGEQGFPVHVEGEVFFALAHPAGWCRGQQGSVHLVQYPAVLLEAGDSFSGMETVIGVSEPGNSKSAFRSLIESRMRRIRAGHDHAYAVYDNYGCWEMKNPTDFLEDRAREETFLESFKWLAEAEQQTGLHFDYNNHHFWFDLAGDIERPDPEHFPQGFDRVFAELKRQNIKPGLWIDSTLGHWNIGKNPLVAPCQNYAPEYQCSSTLPKIFCRATDPIKTMFTEAFKKHLDDGVRLCKFDNFIPWCTNPAHDHFPGVYSTEAIQNSMIEFLGELSAHCPDVFLMLYWGFRSPWWLLHGDTLFEPGLCIEAASPGATPTPYARCGVTDGLDAAQVWADEVPRLGKDSLGIWLSDWGWNSSIGREKWQDSFVMDIMRGSLLPQIWSDWGLLDEPQRVELARFVKLVKQNESCFRDVRPVLGQPGTGEAYGMVGFDGTRAFLAVHNAGWSDLEREISISEDLHLPEKTNWNAFRWHPSPAQLASASGDADFPSSIPLRLRPWKTCLIELVPEGAGNCLEENLTLTPALPGFEQPSREWKLRLRKPKQRKDPESGNPILRLSGAVTVEEEFRGLLLLSVEALNEQGKVCRSMHPQDMLTATLRVNGKMIRCTKVLGDYTYPINWQGWRKDRIRLSAGSRIEFETEGTHPDLAKLAPRIRLIPER